jgi:NADPH2:quinone reductase
MKAAFFRKTGEPNVIEWGDLPTPAINDDQVLVKVAAVTVNPLDTYIRSGKYTPKLPQPYIIGREMVGTVSKVGAHVTEFKPGQRVWTSSLGYGGKQGSFAEYVAVDQDYLYHAPANADDKLLVSVVHTGSTAALGLIRDAQLRATDTIFVNGGGGSIGSAVIQLAKARGAYVIVSTSGQDKIDWCKSIGADIVFDYKKDNLEEKVKEMAPDGVNVYWETSRNPNFDLGINILAKRGRFILMSGSGSNPPFPVGPFYNKECTLKGLTILMASPAELRQCADLVNMCIERNLLKSKIAQVLPMSEAAKAHAMMEARPEIWGKIVLTV